MSKGRMAGLGGMDFHCHVDLYPDPPGVIAACERERILTLAVTTTPKAWPQNKRWVSGSEWVFAAVGLHPELVGERHHEAALLEHYVGESRLVGEIGLDGSPDHKRYWKQQTEVFVRVLKRAQSLGGRVTSIHSRRAAEPVVDLLAMHTSIDGVLPILHWFSGSIKVAARAWTLGCYFSINPRMLEHDAGLKLVKAIPVERLLLETDAPFSGDRLALPTGVNADVAVMNLARVLDMTPGSLQSVLTANASRVLAFAGVELRVSDRGSVEG